MYSWLVPSLDKYLSIKKIGRLPHAILLCAGDGMGIDTLAKEIARDFLCTAGSGEECECHSCKMFADDGHPDYKYVGRGSSMSIGVDVMREGIASLEHTSVNAHGKVLFIQDAHLMTLQAANALLKTLEEPPEGTLIILTTNNMKALLPTIISRTMYLQVVKPSFEILNTFVQQATKSTDDFKMELAITGNSPLKTINLIELGLVEAIKKSVMLFAKAIEGQESPLTFVNFFDKNISDDELRFSVMYHLIKDIMMYQSGISTSSLSVLYNYEGALKKLQNIDPDSLSDALSKLMNLKRIQQVGIKISPINTVQLLVWMNLLCSVVKRK